MTAMRNAIAGAFAIVLSCGAVSAADDPDIVKAEVTRAADECRAKGGKPDTEAMLKAEDLTGRGGPDWVVDFAKLKCAGAANPFCGSGGCALQVFLWNGTEWRSAASEIVRKYRVVTSGGRRTIEMQMAGAACGKANFRSCRKTLRFDRDGLVPERPEKKRPYAAAQAFQSPVTIETNEQRTARIAEEQRFEAERLRMAAEHEEVRHELGALRARRERGEKIDAEALSRLEQRYAELERGIDAALERLAARYREQPRCCAQDRRPPRTDAERERARQEALRQAQKEAEEKFELRRAQARADEKRREAAREALRAEKRETKNMRPGVKKLDEWCSGCGNRGVNERGEPKPLR